MTRDSNNCLKHAEVRGIPAVMPCVFPPNPSSSPSHVIHTNPPAGGWTHMLFFFFFTTTTMKISPPPTTTTTTTTVPWFPPLPVCGKLFATGATVGPLVDSIHNQSLLRYHVAPIWVSWPLHAPVTWTEHREWWIATSWTIPPLLGIAYVVLGGVLPLWMDRLLSTMSMSSIDTKSSSSLRTRAIWAVLTTALIIELSDVLETAQQQQEHLWTTSTVLDSSLSSNSSTLSVLFLLGIALSQWALLDGTLAALLTASIVAVGGPLSELPFVACGVWEYLPEASDYFPLQGLPDIHVPLWMQDYRSLALSGITGPCYFAVTMDAIALGRWFGSNNDNDGGIEQ